MDDNWVQIKFFDKIFIDDWPLDLLNRWLSNLLVNNSIDPRIWEAFDNTWNIGKGASLNDFRDMIVTIRFCINTGICQGNCTPRSCFTAGYIKRVLLERDLNEYSSIINDRTVQMKIVTNFFDKLSYRISVPRFRTRIGILLFSLSSDKEFVKLQNEVIARQLSSNFYVSMSHLLVEKTARYIKKYIDTVVVIVDSKATCDDMYSQVSRLSYLTVFLVKAADADGMDDKDIKSKYKLLFPKNPLVIFNWLEAPEGFHKCLCKRIVPAKRFMIAFRSLFHA